MLQTAHAAGLRKRHFLDTGCSWLQENENTASLHLFTWWWRKEKPLSSDRRQKTKIYFSNSSWRQWLISDSPSLMHINQIINNFLRDHSSATAWSTCKAFIKRCCISDQTIRKKLVSAGTLNNLFFLLICKQWIPAFLNYNCVPAKNSLTARDSRNIKH